MASGFRRLLADHTSLHNSDLPPNYLFPPSTTHSSIPDDLRQLTIFLAGPPVTPYSQGLWRLHLRIPEDYPRSPPKAAFKTRIWHPNVEESTGATISCLLIHPNPDSALNSAAGALLQDDYEAFARQAKLMTSIHAPVPPHLKELVSGAKRRGEDPSAKLEENTQLSVSVQTSKTTRTTSSVVMKRKISSVGPTSTSNLDIRLKSDCLPEEGLPAQPEEEPESDGECGSASKENDPSLSPSPVIMPAPSPRKSILGKRPLAAIAPPESDEIVVINDDDQRDFNSLSASERNIVSNITSSDYNQLRTPQRKSPKLSELGRGSIKAPSRFHISSDVCNKPGDIFKGNIAASSARNVRQLPVPDPFPMSNDSNSSLSCSGLGLSNAAYEDPSKHSRRIPIARKVPGSGVKTKPRTGLRRL
ncbi:hypothetical protein UREG_05889 [Uncinocarpus reesii 1704]|uniref:UBC core domain-containing protein n=1 Tax=Uncinocarpus reesii (strain UAMH 1704) TaxID=336963 RepID=C4JTV0_UNCRE|nr:uncharacterized protein UREG_05889 [Uncinocarpus reesii 1704]EEP81047.1 hypothetical protein UREG_05889 [Uncinocarpus reesii 1704]